MAALENIITIGPSTSPILTLYNAPEHGNGDGVSKVDGVFAVDVIGDELSIDEVHALVHYGGALDVGMDVWEVYLGPDNEVYVDPDGESVYAQLLASAPDGERDTDVNLRELPYGTPVKWQCDGRAIAAFYLKNVDRVGRYKFRLNTTSGVGLLDNADHAGGVYTGQTFATVLADIVGGLFPVTVAPAIADQEVYNWLPYDTRRNNLHQLLFVFGAALRRDEDGNAIVVFLSDDSPRIVENEHVSIGGEVDYETPATRVEITEHAYFADANADEVVLFDNTAAGSGAASSTPIRFATGVPMQLPLTPTGSLTIEESGVNYAVVSGVGTLKGKPYTHITRIVAQDVPNAAGKPNVKHVTDMTLVSLANSLNVARRVLAYCSSAKTVSASIMLDGERCGDVLSVNDPFYESMTAFLQSVSVNASSDLWGPCKLIEGYVPQYQGNNITGSVTLRGAGVWTSPIDGTITAILSSGAQGGWGGYNGADSPKPSASSFTTTSPISGTTKERGYYLKSSDAQSNAGGAAGTPGAGGRVLVVTMSVTVGQQIPYNCGVGGAGGQGGAEPTAGALGTDTTFGSYSTANGTSSEAGFIDPITGDQFAQKGQNGVSGGDGVGFKKNENNEWYLFTPGAITVNGVEYAAGLNGTAASADGSAGDYGHLAYHAVGGFGGGPAFKGSGKNGGSGSGTLNLSSSYHPPIATSVPGVGGDGADAAAPDDETTMGRGGTGGNGGGGAGAFGTALERAGGTPDASQSIAYQSRGDRITVNATLSVSIGTPASGGAGSIGGKGGDGGIRIYWGQ